jgi:hypothetical protein
VNSPLVAPTFGGDESGSFVQPLAKLSAQNLLQKLPVQRRTQAATPGFLAKVQSIASTWADVANAMPKLTPDEVKSEIQAIEAAARDMLDRLSGLAGVSEAFNDLQTGSMYLFMRNDEAGTPAPGRPEVPALPTDARSLSQLFQRLHSDLDALRVCCDYTAQKIEPSKSSTKWLEREVAGLVAKAHHEAFGEWPPLSDWFVKDFMGFVGEGMKRSIGKTVVIQAVNACRSSSLD